MKVKLKPDKKFEKIEDEVMTVFNKQIVQKNPYYQSILRRYNEGEFSDWQLKNRFEMMCPRCGEDLRGRAVENGIAIQINPDNKKVCKSARFGNGDLFRCKRGHYVANGFTMYKRKRGEM